MKKLVSFIAAAAMAASCFAAVPVSAAEVTTQVYFNNFNDKDENGDQTVVTDVSDGSALNSTYYSTVDGTKAVQLRRSSGSTSTGRISFGNTTVPVSGIMDNNYKIVISYDANILNLNQINTSSKTIKTDYVLGTADAAYSTGSFGGLRFQAKVTSDYTVGDWTIYFVDSAGNTTSLTTMTNDDFIAQMQSFKLEYVLRENGADKNVARVYINGTQYGGDLVLGEIPAADAASMVLRLSYSDVLPRNNLDNLLVQTVTDDEITEPDPDPDPSGDDNHGYIAKSDFEDSSTDLWSITRDDVYSVESDTAYGTGNMLKINGKSTQTIYARALFKPTYLLNSPTDDAGTALSDLEGINGRNITEFDIKPENLIASGQSVTVNLGKAEGSTSPIIAVIFNGEAGKIQFRYADNSSGTNGTVVRDGSVPFEFEDGNWYRVRVEIKATGGSGTSQRKAAVRINGDEVLGSSYFASTSASNASQYDQVTIIMPTGDEAADSCAIGLDNFSVYKYNDESAADGVGTTANAGGLITAIRQAQNLYENAVQGDGDEEYSAARVNALIAAAANAYEVYADSSLTTETANEAEETLILAIKKFVPNKVKLVISEPVFQYADAETGERKTMTSLSDADTMYTITEVVSAVDFETAQQPVTAIIAAYRTADDALCNISTASGTITPDSALSIEAESDLTSLTGDRTEYYVKVYVWDTFGNMVPLKHCADNYSTAE